MLSKSRGKIFRTIARTVLILARSIDHFYLKQRLEVLAFDLISASGEVEAENNLEKIKSLIILSGETGYVAEENTREMIVFIREAFERGKEEVNNLDIKTIIREAKSSIGNEDRGSEKIVRKSFENTETSSNTNLDINSEKNSSETYVNSEINLKPVNSENFKKEKKISRSQNKSEERRGRILSKLRQDGISFLKDLSVLFPDVTERTLRYDLEQLIKEGVVEKIGNSGPGTFYRVK